MSGSDILISKPLSDTASDEISAMIDDIMSMPTDQPIALPLTRYGIARRLMSVGRRLTMRQGSDLPNRESPGDSILTKVKGSELLYIIRVAGGWYLQDAESKEGETFLTLCRNAKYALRYQSYHHARLAAFDMAGTQIVRYDSTNGIVYD